MTGNIKLTITSNKVLFFQGNLFMAEFTINALSQRLKQTNKDLKNVKRHLLFYKILNLLYFGKGARSKRMKMQIREVRLHQRASLLLGALENRKRAISSYQRFKAGHYSDKSFVLFAFLRYRYYKNKLQKQR